MNVIIVRYKINGFLLSPSLDTATKNKKTIGLTHQETEALKLFFKAENGFIDSKTLESEIWAEQIVTQNSLRKLISSLRLKFEDKDAFKNIRGKGYELTFDRYCEDDGNSSKARSSIFVSAFILLTLFTLAFHFTYSGSIPKQQAVSKQTVFQSNNNIIDYDVYNGELYVTARSQNSSKVYKVKNRQNTVLLSADYTGAFRGIEIHSSGRTVMHVVEDGKCKFKIFARPVSEQIDEIPCNRNNAYASFDWIDENKLYVTYNVVVTDAVRPYIYDLENKTLERVNATNFDSSNDQRFIDAFIKSRGQGMFSLRENHLGEMSLWYFEDDDRKELYKYRAMPYSIGVAKDNLYFISNNNELLQLPLTENVLAQNLKPSVLLAPQASKIDDPLILADELYISLGNTSREIIRSVSGDFSYRLENGIRDFTYTEKVLSVLAFTNTGYVVEQLKDGEVINSIYFDTNLSLRHVAYFDNEIFLAGSSGIFKLVNGEPKRLSDLRTFELTSTGKCMLAESKGIHKYDLATETFIKLETQGNRPFASQKGCLYASKLSGDVFNENRQVVAKHTMMKLMIEHKGKIAHRYHQGEHTIIKDVETGEVIAKTPSRALATRLESYEDDILYLDKDDVHASIVKLKLN